MCVTETLTHVLTEFLPATMFYCAVRLICVNMSLLHHVCVCVCVCVCARAHVFMHVCVHKKDQAYISCELSHLSISDLTPLPKVMVSDKSLGCIDTTRKRGYKCPSGTH